MKINAINNASGQLTIDPGASGDSFIQFDINAIGKFRIGVDDTDDSFRVSLGSALGTSDMWIMTAAGERTMPLQPAFAGFLGTTDADVTGNGAQYILGTTGNALTVIFDQGSDFTTAGVFTAPVLGRYHLSMGILVEEAGTATNSDPRIDTSNRNYRIWQLQPGTVNVGGSFEGGGTAFADMDAADTAVAKTSVSGVGANTCDIFGAATDPRSFFCGFLEV